MHAESIKYYSHCLWEGIVRFIHGCEHSDDAEYILQCYESLSEALKFYYQQKRTDIPEEELFFAEAVLDAYRDLVRRSIVKTN